MYVVYDGNITIMSYKKESINPGVPFRGMLTFLGTYNNKSTYALEKGDDVFVISCETYCIESLYGAYIIEAVNVMYTVTYLIALNPHGVSIINTPMDSPYEEELFQRTVYVNGVCVKYHDPEIHYITRTAPLVFTFYRDGTSEMHYQGTPVETEEEEEE